MDKIIEILKTAKGKVIAAITTAIVAILAYATELGTDWSTIAQQFLSEKAENVETPEDN